MKSIVSALGKNIDCTSLYVKGTFFSFTYDEAISLAQSYIELVEERFANECVLDIRFDNYVLKNLESSIQKHGDPSGSFIISLEGRVKDEFVYNKKTYHAMWKKLENYFIYVADEYDPGHSVDYNSYFDNNIEPFLKNESELEKALYRLFDEENRLLVNQTMQNDFMGLFYLYRMDNTDKYYGGFDLNISCYCIDSCLDEWAESLYLWSESVFKSYETLSIIIERNRETNDYQTYFRSNASSRDYNYTETSLFHYLRHFYFTGVGWANFICKKTVEATGLMCPENPSVLCTECRNGGIIIRSKSEISKLSINELKTIKLAMYPALFPGKQTHDMNIVTGRFIRAYWEYVPVLDGELRVMDGKVVFQKPGELISPKKLCEVMELDYEDYRTQIEK